jgi:hypothetical protein
VDSWLAAQYKPGRFEQRPEPFDEATVPRLGHAYEQASGWRRRRPVPG